MEELDLGTPAPLGAIILFDGTEESLHKHWEMWPDDSQEIRWKMMPDPFDEGLTMMSCCARGYGKEDIITQKAFTDFEGHVEFIMMGSRNDQTSEGYCNSGVYLQNRHEIQIETLPDPVEGSNGKHDIGSICKEQIPDTTLWREQGNWQSFHFIFTAAQWDGNEMIEKARTTIWWNGVKVHDNVEVMFAKGGVEVGPKPQGLKLQEHGTDVRFRNIWIKETGSTSNQKQGKNQRNNIHPFHINNNSFKPSYNKKINMIFSYDITGRKVNVTRTKQYFPGIGIHVDKSINAHRYIFFEHGH